MPAPAAAIHTNCIYLLSDTNTTITAMPRMMIAVLKLFVPYQCHDRQYQSNHKHQVQKTVPFFSSVFRPFLPETESRQVWQTRTAERKEDQVRAIFWNRCKHCPQIIPRWIMQGRSDRLRWHIFQKYGNPYS